MNIYEKAVEGLALAKHDASVIQQSAEDIGVWITVLMNDLMDTNIFRLHDEEVTWWAEYYDEQQNEKQ
jgi:hypothetical protein